MDSNFGNNGVVLIDIENTTSDYFNDILVQNNDKILLSSKYFYNGNYSYEIRRVSSEGIVDLSFGVDGKITPFLDV